ncbi:hypothetical protein QBC47DRAFT_380178 [Echria macrotheca]|uniref:Zn(2)-C6 fungal-type domain-containing protein n=1 Tax=Echria macrotheca TaxID=438768 RepID=A0AAJ0BE41_9PEZI|nr:hypothetical protein QBC47DRAFT_380178 [Echria macrotheca]
MPTNQAPVACHNCRRLKRRCTRELPFCSLCVRLGKSCHYSPRDSVRPGSESSAVSSSRVDPFITPDALVGSSSDRASSSSVTPTPGLRDSAPEFPSSFFLDPEFFNPLTVDSLNTAALPLTIPCLTSLGMDLVGICHAYVATINQWLPILSPKRLCTDVVQINPVDPDPGLVLLLACIRLLSDASYSGRCQEYKVAKALASSVENEGIISLRLVQSIALLGWYELAHGIYPSAYLTSGHGARLVVLGCFHNQERQTPHLFKIADTWTVREEERRVSWGLFILEKFLHAGTGVLPQMIPKMATGLSLPINDIGWSKGDLDTSESSLVLSSISADIGSMGRFATTCQAAHLYCHALTHRDAGKDGEPLPDESFRLDEALQLHRTLSALDESLALDDTAEANIEAVALLSTARYILYNMYSCKGLDIRCEPEKLRRQVEMQRASVKGVMDLSANRVPRIANIIIELLAVGTAETRGRNVSPIVCHTLYHAATECAWFIREGCGPEMTAGLNVVVSALDQLKGSWDVAEHYYNLLGYEETVAKMFNIPPP